MNRAAMFRPCGKVLLLACVVCLAGAVPAHAQWESYRSKPFLRTNPKFLEVFRPVVAPASRSTVRVSCDEEDVALGTIVGADGWILTKASDLTGKIVCRIQDGREFDAYIVGVHEGHDLALLRIKAQHLPAVSWRTTKEEAVGNWVASVGMSEQPVAVGVISVAARKLPERARPVALIGGYLGVGLEAADEGVRIIEIMKNTAAAKAKLRVNDLVLSVSGQPVDSVEGLQGALQKYKAGDVVAVRIKRGDEELDVSAKLGKRPPARADVQNSMGSELSERRWGFSDILQHDSVVKPKDCGGPLVDLDGKVIGVNICRAGRTESYAVPAEVIQPLLPELMSGRLVPRPMETTATSK
jgi:serine protease Do